MIKKLLIAAALTFGFTSFTFAGHHEGDHGMKAKEKTEKAQDKAKTEKEKMADAADKAKAKVEKKTEEARAEDGKKTK